MLNIYRAMHSSDAWTSNFPYSNLLCATSPLSLVYVRLHWRLLYLIVLNGEQHPLGRPHSLTWLILSSLACKLFSEEKFIVVGGPGLMQEAEEQGRDFVSSYTLVTNYFARHLSYLQRPGRSRSTAILSL